MILMHGMAVILMMAACLTGVETVEMSGTEQTVENPTERPDEVETEQVQGIAEQNAESFLKEFFSFNRMTAVRFLRTRKVRTSRYCRMRCRRITMRFFLIQNRRVSKRWPVGEFH